MSLVLAAQAGSADVPAETPAMAAARANQARVKTPSRFRSGPRPVPSEESTAAGETGQVILAGIVGVDGRLGELQILESSRSRRLDSAAMAAAAAASFEPAKDEEGAPIATRKEIAVEFNNVWSSGTSGGLLGYTCRQFVRDQDWWSHTWPAGKHDAIYKLASGMAFLPGLAGGQARVGGDALHKSVLEFDRRWKAAVESCRKAPDKLFVDELKPEGEALRQLAMKGQL